MKVIGSLNVGFVVDNEFIEMYGDALKKTIRKIMEHFLITHGIGPDISSPEITTFAINPAEISDGE